jgi:hypothetical protein
MDMEFWLWLFRPRLSMDSVGLNDCKGGTQSQIFELINAFDKAVSNSRFHHLGI